MKKFIATLLCSTLIYLGGLAQDATSHKPFLDSSPTNDLLDLEVGIGIGSSAFAQNYGKVITTLADLETASGIKLNAGVNATFNLRNFLGLSTGLWMNINNSSYTMTLVDANVGTLNTLYGCNHYYSATIPVFLTFRFNIADNVTWNVDGGIYFTQGLAGTTKVRTYVSGSNQLGQSVVTTNNYQFRYYDEKYPLIHGIQRNDWGLHFGMGFRFNHRYKISFDANLGIRDLAMNHGVYDCMYRTWDTVVNLLHCF